MAMDFSSLLGTGSNWTGAHCLNRPDEFCPREDIMTSPEWTRSTAPRVSQECLTCPVFEQCRAALFAELEDPDVPTTGIMAGVILVQKSGKQIRNALTRVETAREEALAELAEEEA